MPITESLYHTKHRNFDSHPQFVPIIRSCQLQRCQLSRVNCITTCGTAQPVPVIQSEVKIFSPTGHLAPATVPPAPRSCFLQLSNGPCYLSIGSFSAVTLKRLFCCFFVAEGERVRFPCKWECLGVPISYVTFKKTFPPAVGGHRPPDTARHPWLLRIIRLNCGRPPSERQWKHS